MQNKFHSNGKLLLTAEYVVLDGAKALGLPTKLGQSLNISEAEPGKILWESLDEKDAIWFSGGFFLRENRKQNQLEIFSDKDDSISNRLLQILREANQLNPSFLYEKKGFSAVAKLEFPSNWGLGSSSTLINNIAECFQVDAYELLEKTFGGSGFDIACAKNDFPITYELKNLLRRQAGGKPAYRTGRREIHKADFNPVFKEHLFFVYLNQKQNSRKAIQHYRSQEKNRLFQTIDEISKLTELILDSNQLAEFEKLIGEHEKILAFLLDMPPIKNQLFPNYPHTIKSLGGWGGDFVLATGGEEEKSYFRKKGFNTILDYSEII